MITLLYGKPIEEASGVALLDGWQAVSFPRPGTIRPDGLSRREAGAIIEAEILGRLNRLEAIEEGGIERFANGMSFRRRCAPCYSSGRTDAKYGKFCHRCGSREELT